MAAKPLSIKIVLFLTGNCSVTEVAHFSTEVGRHEIQIKSLAAGRLPLSRLPAGASAEQNVLATASFPARFSSAQG